MLLIDSSDQLWTQLRTSSDKQQSQDGKTLGKVQFVQQLLLFLNTYNMLQEGNQLAVFAVDGSGRYATSPSTVLQEQTCNHSSVCCSHSLFQNLKPSSNEDSTKSSAEQVLDGLIARSSAAQMQSSMPHIVVPNATWRLVLSPCMHVCTPCQYTRCLTCSIWYSDAHSTQERLLGISILASQCLSVVVLMLQHVMHHWPGCMYCCADRHALPCWSAALSRALCLVRKHQGNAPSSKADSPKPRILCISGSPDVPGQYIAVMNAIFSAQVCRRC